MRIAFAMTVALGFGQAYAFHSGGVAECSGCHSMHSPAPDGYALLVGTDASSACLTCHESPGDTGPNSYHVSTAAADMVGAASPLQRGPGGDFGWLKKTYTWQEGSGSTSTIGEEPGHERGHSIIALDRGYSVDTVNSTAPGGTFVAADLGCQSCHDPHGQGRRTLSGGMIAAPALGSNVGPIMASGSYNNSPDPTATEAVGLYRILAYPGYTRAGGVTWGGFPVAVAPATYNRSEAVTDTRVAYAGTATNSWGDWCGSCHGDMHSSGNYVHPVENALGTLANVYNAYVASGNLSGTAGTAFTSLVPFAENTVDFTVLKSHAFNDGSQTAGPGTGDRVTCMSCHRAHASAFPYALRWQPEYEFITRGGAYIAPGNPLVTGTRAGIQARGRTTLAQQQAGYYDRPATKFATYQRLLCNKCHGKD